MRLVCVAAIFGWVGIFCTLSKVTVIRQSSIHLQPANFKLLSTDDSSVIGTAHFRIIKRRNTPTELTGDYRFTNGEYDIDEDWLNIPLRGVLPQLLKYKHTFFHGDGSLDRVSEADFRNGNASCTIYVNGHAKVEATTLNFPANTYAGPAVIMPIRYFLLHRSTSAATFHYFSCAPNPEIFDFAASSEQPVDWTFYPGKLVKVEIRPEFGWLDVVIAPFVPRIRLWFDPAHDFEFVGAASSRYYKGLKFIMVRDSGKSIGEEEAPLLRECGPAQPNPLKRK